MTEPTRQVRLFISHSSDDAELTSKLIELLRSSLNLSASEIRCTSVDGYRLPGGAATDDQLRLEINRAEAFIAVISDRSLNSLYVLFELGARWGAGKQLIPLLTADASPEILSGPLARLNCLRANSAAQIQQLVAQIAKILGVHAETADVFQRHIDAIVAMAKKTSREVAPQRNALQRRPKSSSGVSRFELTAEGARGKATLTLRHRGPATQYVIEGRIIRTLDDSPNPAPQVFHAELQPGADRKGEFNLVLEDGEFVHVVVADIGDNRNEWGGTTWLQVRRGKYGNSTRVPDEGVVMEYVVRTSSEARFRYAVTRHDEFIQIKSLAAARPAGSRRKATRQ